MPSQASSGWSLTGASLGERALLTVSSLAAIGLLYAVYSFAVASLVKTPALKGRDRMITVDVPPKDSSPAREMARKYLAHLPWVADSTCFSGQQYILFFQKWSPVEDNKKVVRFEPFALIWLQKNRKADEAPYTVDSEKASITFEKDFEMKSLDPGPIEGAALENDVQITGPDLVVNGRNFFFADNAKRIWSDDHVDFTIRKSRGNARGLQIDLIPGEPTKRDGVPAVAGVKSFRLLRNVVLDLVSDQPEQSQQMGLSHKPDPKKNQKGPDVINVRCDGSCEYVLTTTTATLTDNVFITHPTGSGKTDRLQNAEIVELKFEKQADLPAGQKPSSNGPSRSLPNGPAEGSAITPVSATAASRPSTKATSSATKSPASPDRKTDAQFVGLDSKVTFHKLHARGRKLRLISDGNQLNARATNVQYDRLARTAYLSNPGKATSSAEESEVLVVQKSTVLRCPEINLNHDEKSAITHVSCRGAGRLASYNEQNSDVCELWAEWKKELRKFPDPQAPFDIIELEEQALLQQPEQQWGLAAEHIRIWLDPVRREKTKVAKNIEARRAENSDRTRPRYMLAWQNVALVNPEIQAQSEQLQVWFEDRPAAASTAVGSSNLRSRNELVLTSDRNIAATPARRVVINSSPAGRPREGRAMLQSNAQAFASTPDQPRELAEPGAGGSEEARRSGNPSAPSEARKARGEQKRKRPETMPRRPNDGPFEVESNLIQVRVLQGAERNDAAVAEIWTKGNVRARQEHATGEEPFRMFGDDMHIENRGPAQEVLRVIGRPAHIHDRGVYMEGGEIHFDRGENSAHIPGVGRLQLPVSQSFDGKPLDKPLPLDIFWKEQMTFDGLTAHFFGTVQAKMDDERTKNDLRCAEMKVILTDKMNFSGRENRKDARVRNVFCEGTVEFDSDEFVSGRCVDIRRMRAATFQLDQITGNTKAQGPGTITRWQFGKDRPSGLGPLSVQRANAPVKPNTAEWTYMRAEFSGEMSGNTNQRSTTFHNDVDVLYGPVEKETDTVDRDNLGEEAGWMGCDSLTVTQHPEAAATPSYAELLAQGNSRLEGRSYYGRSDTISYDGSKGQFILSAQGDGNATIWRQVQRGGQQEPLHARRIEFNPRDNTINLNRVTGFNGAQ